MPEQTFDLFPTEGFTATQFVTSADVARSADFYARILGGKVVREGEPTVVQLANTWVIINTGGGPTDDKPTVHLAPPSDADRFSTFMELRVADIHALYDLWKRRGAEFITEPRERDYEWRCYLRDPDGYIIEVGQAKQAG